MTDAAALAWADGKVGPLAAATVPLDDRAHLLGDGVFETLKVRNGAILHRELHAHRLRRALDLIGIAATAADEAWNAADQLVKAATGLGAEFALRVQVTPGRDGGFTTAVGKPRVTAIARPIDRLPATHYADGIVLAVAEERKDTHSRLSTIKTNSFLPHVHARRRAQAWGAHDALLLNDQGRVAEATTSNVVARVGKFLHAPGPEEGAVDGVTRRRVVAWAERTHQPVVAKLTPAELGKADEVVLVNTLAGVVPVRRVEGLRDGLPGGKGELLARLRHALGEAPPGA